MNTPRKRRRAVKINALTFAKLLAMTREGIYSNRELAEATGLHYLTVCSYTRELHREGVLHIAAWKADAQGRITTKVFRLGQAGDVVRQPSKSKLTARLTACRKQGKREAHAGASSLLSPAFP